MMTTAFMTLNTVTPTMARLTLNPTMAANMAWWTMLEDKYLITKAMTMAPIRITDPPRLTGPDIE